MTEETGERLARYIALCGMASRRAADRLVQDGHVTVNGQTVTNPAERIHPPEDHVKVDGRSVRGLPQKAYFLYHKPKGVVTTKSDPEERTCLTDVLPQLPVRVEPVGRLDFDTEGALLLTNDGELAHRLTHPSYKVPRTYIAKVYRTPATATLERLRKGIHLEDGQTAPCRIKVLGATERENAWLEITVFEGRNRLVRRMLETMGHPVSKLRRAAYGPVQLGTLPRGALRALEPWEVAELRRITREPAPGKPRRKTQKPPRKDGAKPSTERWTYRSSGERKGRI